MKRSDFIKTTLGLLTIPAVIKALPEEQKPMFNIERLKERKKELEKYPVIKDYELIDTKFLSNRNYSPQEILRLYQETGILIY